MTGIAAFFAATLVSVIGAETPPQAFELQDGDRVVFVGNTFVERAQNYGHLETHLTAAWPDRKMIFRNLGWSGDTVFGDARSYFGPPKEGFERLEKNLSEIEPTVILTCYGAVAAFEGEADLPKFIEGYGILIDMMKETEARIVLVSPPPAENLPAPLPNLTEHNSRLAIYRDAIRSLATEKEVGFADLFETLGAGSRADETPHLTDNGLHFTEEGYATIAPFFLEALGVPVAKHRVAIDVASGTAEAQGGEVEVISAQPNEVVFKLSNETLPLHPNGQTIQITGLDAGDYEIDLGGVTVSAPASVFEDGAYFAFGHSYEQGQQLRQRINKKNELFFHRWRPQNETYLFGFRKHEQGQNAREIPQFDPLVAEEELRIAEQRQPKAQTFKLTRKEEVAP